MFRDVEFSISSDGDGRTLISITAVALPTLARTPP
jgi:hypothetical protein